MNLHSMLEHALLAGEEKRWKFQGDGKTKVSRPRVVIQRSKLRVSSIRLGSREDWWDAFPPFCTGSDPISVPSRKMPYRLNISNTQNDLFKRWTPCGPSSLGIGRQERHVSRNAFTEFPMAGALGIDSDSIYFWRRSPEASITGRQRMGKRWGLKIAGLRVWVAYFLEQRIGDEGNACFENMQFQGPLPKFGFRRSGGHYVGSKADLKELFLLVVIDQLWS